MSILIADDNSVARRALALMLTHAGFAVDEADGGNMGVQLFARGSYDLVISDLDMPDMDGVELARRIRQMNPGIEIYAFTGSSGTMLMDEARTVFTRVFAKPAEMTRLVAEVKAYCSALAAR
jgi:CheY-like chemotaxis protein